MQPSDRREATLADVLDELKAQGSRKKDWWERITPVLTIISTLTLGAAGLWFTKSYNDRQAEFAKGQAERDAQAKQHQNQVLEMQAVEKFIPHLTSNDEAKKKVVILIINSLASPQTAANLAQLHESQGTQAATDVIMATATPPSQRHAPAAVTSKVSSAKGSANKSGWVYLGHYEPEKRTGERSTSTSMLPPNLQA